LPPTPRPMHQPQDDSDQEDMVADGRDQVFAGAGLSFDPFRNFPSYDGTTNASIWLSDYEKRVRNVEDRMKSWYFPDFLSGEAHEWFETTRLIEPLDDWDEVKREFLSYFKFTQGTPLDWSALHELKMGEKELCRTFAIRVSKHLISCGVFADKEAVFTMMMAKLSKTASEIVWGNPPKSFQELLERDAALANKFRKLTAKANVVQPKKNVEEFKRQLPNKHQEKNNNLPQKSKLICTRCGKIGHNEKTCWSAKPKIRRVEITQSEITSTVYVLDNSMKALFDTGAQASLIDCDLAKQKGLKIEKENSCYIRGIDGRPVHLLGSCEIPIKFKEGDSEVEILWRFFVAEKVNLGKNIAVLVGCDLASAAGIIIYCGPKIVRIDEQFIRSQMKESGNNTPVNTIIKPRDLSNKTSWKACRMLHVGYHTEIPPKSCKIIKCVFGPKNPKMNGDYMVKEYGTNCRFLARFEKGWTIIPVTNARNESVIMHRGCPIGKVNRVLEPIEFAEHPRIMSAQRLPEVEINVSEIDINTKLPKTDQQRIYNLIMKYPVLFDDEELGKCSIMAHRINTGNNEPVKTHPHRQSQLKREATQKLIQEFVDQDLVTPSESPWASPVVLVHKKNGKFRFCVDYRQLNAITTKDVYPLPNIEDSLSYLEGARIFSIIDLRSGYHQIEVNPEDRQKTAFITQDGLFEWKVMPFGLTNAPATFQRTMDTVLAGLKYNSCLVYLDDILVFSRTMEEHLVILEKVFSRLLQADLRISLEKSRFGLEEILYLGYVISPDGQKPDPEKLAAVQQFPLPDSITMLQSFLGLCNYYRKFVEGFSKLSAPLYAMTKKDAEFEWTNDTIEVFNKLKEKLCSPPVLTHYHQNRPHKVHTDASQVGLGAVLLQQEPDGSWRVISYISRRTSKAEANYSITELEGTAVIFALEKFRPYLEGTSFTIVTDHCALCQLKNRKNLNRRLARWLLTLQDFDCKLEYKSGKKHTDADCLSRYPVEGNREDQDSDRPSVNIRFLKSGDHWIMSPSVNIDQTDDPWIKGIIKKLQNLSSLPIKERRSLDRYVLISQEHLYRKIYDGGVSWAIVVPAKQRQDVIRINHDGSAAGHLGIEATYQRIRRKYYFRNMYNLIEDYVRKCVICNAHSKERVENSPLESIRTDEPFSTIGMDVMGPLPVSDGKRFIIVAVDHFTKWAETRACSNQKTSTIKKFFTEQVLLRHGNIKRLITDQGTNFLSDVFKTFLEASKINHTPKTAYHQQANGQCERVNGTLISILKKFVSLDQKDWAGKLAYATFAYNTSPSKSTKKSPFKCLYGREALLPFDSLLVNTNHCITDEEWNALRESIRSNIENAQDNQAFYYNKNVTETKFVKGDRVRLRNDRPPAFGLSKKLEPTYELGWEATEIKGSNVKIRHNDGTVMTVNKKRLKIDNSVYEHAVPQEIPTSENDDTEEPAYNLRKRNGPKEQVAPVPNIRERPKRGRPPKNKERIANTEEASPEPKLRKRRRMLELFFL
jgi:hypothetical protein